MPVALHISDLHRTPAPRIDNDTLLATIDSDSNRWAREGIGRPALLVVSGDLVQGVPLGCDDVEAELAAQYEEAHDFITRLTDRHFEGDRGRVVVVPGNHDVCWPIARLAMEPLTSDVDDLSRQADLPDSRIRWNWQERQAYKIVDQDLYERRLAHFRAFRSRFYEGVTPNPLAHDPDLLHMEFKDLGLVVVGFSSWFGNDCFCVVGDIDPRLLVMAQGIVADSDMPSAVAVWHHNIAGGPRARDYMDDRVVHRLIDAGFVLGLHGHQHRADAAPYELRLPNMSSLCVISAGSLCVGDSELPPGETRQFNLVDIRPADSKITVHVRQMTAGGLFSSSPRMEFGGNSYLILALPVSLARPGIPTRAALLDGAIDAIQGREFARAIQLVDKAGDPTDKASRSIRLEALEGLENWDEILELIGEGPRSADELALVVTILLERQELERAQKIVDAAPIGDRTTVEALREKIEIRRAIR